MVSGKEGKVKEMAGRVVSVQSLISERLPQLEEAKKAAVAGNYLFPLSSHIYKYRQCNTSSS